MELNLEFLNPTRVEFYLKLWIGLLASSSLIFLIFFFFKPKLKHSDFTLSATQSCLFCLVPPEKFQGIIFEESFFLSNSLKQFDVTLGKVFHQLRETQMVWRTTPVFKKIGKILVEKNLVIRKKFRPFFPAKFWLCNGQCVRKVRDVMYLFTISCI